MSWLSTDYRNVSAGDQGDKFVTYDLTEKNEIDITE